MGEAADREHIAIGIGIRDRALGRELLAIGVGCDHIRKPGEGKKCPIRVVAEEPVDGIDLFGADTFPNAFANPARSAVEDLDDLPIGADGINSGSGGIRIRESNFEEIGPQNRGKIPSLRNAQENS